MKAVLFLMVLCAISMPALAEEQTLISGGIESGGFGGPVVKFGKIEGESAVLVGGYGGWLINHRFMIGGGGCGLANRASDTQMGYGGAMLEYTTASNNLIHFYGNLLIGAGSIESLDGSDDEFSVAEPGIHMEMNVTRNIRFGLGGSYRYISAASGKESDLRGPSATLTLKFGKF